MISPAGPSFAACDQLRRAHRRTCSSVDPSRTGSAWRMESIERKRPSRHSSSCQRAQEFLLCSRQGFAGALPSLLLREAVAGPAGLGGMASPALLDQHQTAGLARLGCEPRELRKGSKRIYFSRWMHRLPSTTRISSVSSSIPRWILRQTLRFEPPCLRVCHAPSPSILMPVLSTSRCNSPLAAGEEDSKDRGANTALWWTSGQSPARLHVADFGLDSAPTFQGLRRLQTDHIDIF